MNVPEGKGPFPLLVLNHGHIDTDIYVNGPGIAPRAGLPGARGIRRVAHRLPQPRTVGRRSEQRAGAPARLHGGRSERRDGDQEFDAAVYRQGEHRAPRPIDGGRRHVQRGGGPAGPNQSGGGLRAGQLERGRQLRPVDPTRGRPAGARGADRRRSTARRKRIRRSGRTSRRSPSSTGSRFRS